MERSRSKRDNRLSLPGFLAKTHDLVTSSALHPEQGDRKMNASELAQAVKGELGAWWGGGKRASDNRPILPRRNSSGNDTYAPSTFGASRQRASTSVTPPSDSSNVLVDGSDFAFVPPERSHLHYRDESFRSARPYPQVPHFEHSRYPSSENSGGEVLGKEQEAMREAILASQRERADERTRETQEERDLHRALEESTAFSHRQPPVRSDSTDPDLQRALAESTAFDFHSRTNSPPALSSSPQLAPSTPPGPSPLAPLRIPSPSSSTSPQSSSLDYSERMLRARNEKGGLWREAGAHQWLPQGAGLGGGREESEEQRMLELAIRISLEEEEGRKVRDSQAPAPPLPPRRGVTSSESYSTALSHPASTLSPLSPTSASPTVRRLLPPTRVPPPVPNLLNTHEDEVNLNRTLPPTPASSIAPSITSSNGRKPPLAFIAPSAPKIFSHHSSIDGSPEEMPFLRANESFITAREDATTASVSGDGDEALSRNGTVGTFGESLVESDSATRGRGRGERSAWTDSISSGGGKFSDEESRSRSGSTSANGMSGQPSNRTSFDTGSAEDTGQLLDPRGRFTLGSENFPPHNIPAESLEIRNPDGGLEEEASRTSGGTLPYLSGGAQPSIPGSYPPFRSGTARSMSLISERTEPAQSTLSLALPSHSIEIESPIEEEEHPLGALTVAEDQQAVNEAPRNGNRTPAPSFRKGEERLNVGPSDKLRARLEEERLAKAAIASGVGGAEDSTLADSQLSLASPTKPIEALLPTTAFDPPDDNTLIQNATPPQAELTFEPTEINNSSEGQNRLVEPRIVFGEGVRFGWPAPCAEEPDHSCTTDGLGSQAPFPSEISLTTRREGEMDAVDKFSVEASTWTSLLRFLMWYGDSVVHASDFDVDASETAHCESSLALSFRKNDEGESVLRLTISLLRPDHPAPSHELNIVSPSTPVIGKGKGKAPSRPSSPTFLLPDHQVLPLRLSQIAISLYTLRQLAGIALSTQPAKEASESYHALRTLAISINELAREHDSMDLKKADESKRNNERLVHRLKERLRKFGGLGSGGNNGSDAGKKLTKIPAGPVHRTRNLGREERVLSVEEESLISMDEAASMPQAVDAVMGERELAREMTYMPKLSKT